MKHPFHTVAGTVLAGLVLMLSSGRGQAVSGYNIHADQDIFRREVEKALSSSSVLEVLPILDCSMEYIRRYKGREIVYRRGPVSMEQHGPKGAAERLITGARPVSEADRSDKASFTGEILLDLPRAGEADDYLSPSDQRYKYLVRAAVVPTSYMGRELNARIILERSAVLVREDGRIDIQQSEVFARDITLTGNDPLHFSLPSWEPVSSETVPGSLEEALLVTLETPRSFSFARNDPEPFSSTTRILYAVPDLSLIRLTIQLNGREHVIDEGERNAGVYAVSWDASSVADGKYLAMLTASDGRGKQLHAGSMELTKDLSAPATPVRRSMTPNLTLGRFLVNTESGFAFQLPRDRKKPMRYMFTHVAVRVGYTILPALEAGIVAGQDAFNETPGPSVDIDRIADYGGVVPYTYGYFGPYVRFSMTSGPIQPMAQATLAFSDVAGIAEVGFGARATLFAKIDLFILPHVTMHLRDRVSRKIGVNYGIAVRF